MPQKQKYLPILPKPQDWPVVQLNKARKAFVQAVVDETMQVLLAAHAEEEALRAMLIKTAGLELARAQKKAWKVDPAEEVAFWGHWVATLPEQSPTALPAILREIIRHYAQGIAGKFRMTHYHLAQRTATYTLTRLLNPVSLKRVRSPWHRRTRLQEKIHITGAIDRLRALARVGTIVMVPTHFSHLDSLLLGWVTHTLGLPHFIYGAGLNLFNNRFFAHFLNNLGTYKIDRRRKNLSYLTTLKAYARLALERGCHSLFYPGGTRSRSGALEQQLKLGLLSTAFEAQQHNYARHGPAGRKLFVVPVVLSYHCVLEAPPLIKSYLAAQGIRAPRQRARRALPQKLWSWADSFLTKGSSIVVSIGDAMDLMGNRVDEAGHSYNAQGALVDTYQHFLASASGEGNAQHEADTRALSQAIVAAYVKANCILTSHVLAFVAFSLFRQQHADLSLQALLQLAPAKLVIPYARLEATFSQLHKGLLQLQQVGQVRLEPMLEGTDLTAIVQHGLS
ncbi:MAG: 1-acyl-sn-glycerol-3-phosphate acyltransferase, partial [Bacteroidota bacterium]